MYSNEYMLEEEGDIEHDHPYLISIQRTIHTIHMLTRNVYERLVQTQMNFQKIIELSSQWAHIPMYTRDKNTKLITFSNRLIEMKNVRYEEVRDASKNIQQFLKINLLLFHNIPLTDPNWGKIIFLLIRMLLYNCFLLIYKEEKVE